MDALENFLLHIEHEGGFGSACRDLHRLLVQLKVSGAVYGDKIAAGRGHGDGKRSGRRGYGFKRGPSLLPYADPRARHRGIVLVDHAAVPGDLSCGLAHQRQSGHHQRRDAIEWHAGSCRYYDRNAGRGQT